MYGIRTVLALDEQKVRLLLLMRVRLTLLEAVIGVRCSTYGAVCNFAFISFVILRSECHNVNNGVALINVG